MEVFDILGILKTQDISDNLDIHSLHEEVLDIHGIFNIQDTGDILDIQRFHE